MGPRKRRSWLALKASLAALLAAGLLWSIATLPVPHSVKFPPYLATIIGFVYVLRATFVQPEEQRSVRLREGRCLHCGYDLRTTTFGPCPECGNPTKNAA